MSVKALSFQDIPRFPHSAYEIDVGFEWLEGHLADAVSDGLDIDPGATSSAPPAVSSPSSWRDLRSMACRRCAAPWPRATIWRQATYGPTSTGCCARPGSTWTTAKETRDEVHRDWHRDDQRNDGG